MGPWATAGPPPPFVCCTQKNEHSNNEHPRERHEVTRRGMHELAARAPPNTPSACASHPSNSLSTTGLQRSRRRESYTLHVLSLGGT